MGRERVSWREGGSGLLLLHKGILFSGWNEDNLFRFFPVLPWFKDLCMLQHHTRWLRAKLWINEGKGGKNGQTQPEFSSERKEFFWLGLNRQVFRLFLTLRIHVYIACVGSLILFCIVSSIFDERSEGGQWMDRRASFLLLWLGISFSFFPLLSFLFSSFSLFRLWRQKREIGVAEGDERESGREGCKLIVNTCWPQ